MNLLENLAKAEFLESSQGESTSQNTKYNCFGDESCFCHDPEIIKSSGPVSNYNGAVPEAKNIVYEMK